uniref:Thioredoxin domain-containing protein n=1 Tax=Fibrocapsa japonica TaxID=94617 RepID=A0A7S2XXY5_9STRA|eukprot:CAMPEP_0113944716 /NCGR_PEP_ID=MMETSP1339-20121228/36053_1 /TAXON_ID=94617 /ORGANISM="Fibrocapsa japonica" /LENGTH=395 /DNA_ID=CAMNT_0000950009 /DNA_START=49 /DNA_END=1236 /DNA_ORIENTATION=+ /assembly_acc=CAM_ASM_000762
MGTSLLFAILSTIFFVLQASSAPADPLVQQLSANDIVDNIEVWNSDYMVMFYAPWCPHCRQLSPLYEEISKEITKPDMQLGKFNCEGSQTNLQFCNALNVDRYPMIMFFGYGSFPQGNLLKQALTKTQPALPQAISFDGLLFPEAIKDWAKTCRAVSRFHRFKDNVKALFSFNKLGQWQQAAALTNEALAAKEELQAELAALQQDHQLLQQQSAAANQGGQQQGANAVPAAGSASSSWFGDLTTPQADGASPDLQQNNQQAIEEYVQQLLDNAEGAAIAEEYATAEDPFVVLKEAGYPDEMIALRSCVADMAATYCETVVDPSSEPFCESISLCVMEGFESDQCRPPTCPFVDPRGCELSKVCFQQDVLDEYAQFILQFFANGVGVDLEEGKVAA